RAEDGIRGFHVTGVQTCALPICDVPLHKHPQRQRPKYTHRDWNHPIMRSVKAGRLYDSYEEVLGELETLHVEFPDVTIPGKEKQIGRASCRERRGNSIRVMASQT